MKKNYVFLILLMCLFAFPRLNAQVLEADSLALVDFYNATGGATWDTATNTWLNGPVNTWSGITVTGDRVTEFSTEGKFPSGEIPVSIGQLTGLKILKLIGVEKPVTIMDLHGSIPAEIWNLTNLTVLQIKYTNLTGGIPAGIESMVNLQEINFQQTFLGGEIPAEVFALPALTKLYLHQSNFTGTIPATLANAANVTRLYLHDNKLVGPLPHFTLKSGAKVNLTGNFYTYAEVKPYHDDAAIALTDDYQFARETSNIVAPFNQKQNFDGTATGAESYAWFKDDLTTVISELAVLQVSPTTLMDEGSYTCKAQSSLVGNFDLRSIYTLKFDLTKRERDSLALVDIYNAAGGPNWTNQGNWLTGSIDTWAGVTVTDDTVRVLSLTLNNMSGVISPSIGNLTGLTKLELNGDTEHSLVVDLHGTIPAEIWNCTKITRLQIKGTNITGGIPAGIESMVKLGEINFQQTYLGGEIPAEVFKLPALKSAYLHQSNFTGVVPSTLSNATQLTRLYLHDNKLEGPLPFVNIHNTDTKINLTGNYFSFEDVKPYHDSAAHVNKVTDDYQYARPNTNVVVEEGANYDMAGTVDTAEVYAWFKDAITEPISDADTLKLTNIGFDDEGAYVCKAQSSLVANFDIRSIYNLKLNYTDRQRDSLALVDFYNATGGAIWDTPTPTWLNGPLDTWSGIVVTNDRVTEFSTEGKFPSGEIPASIGQLTALKVLKLIGKENPVIVMDLHGSIPAEIWNLTNLTKLQIKYTNLTGGIPAGIESMVNLQEINFQQTYLGGSIPEELFNLPALKSAYLHQSNFTGTVPASVVNATNLTRLYLHENKLEGPIPFVDLVNHASAKVNLAGNFFTYADVKQYHDTAALDNKAYYSSFIDDYQYAQPAQNYTLTQGDEVTFKVYVKDGVTYNWFYNDAITEVVDTFYTISSVARNDVGTFMVRVQNTDLVANFDIRAIFTIDTVFAIPALLSAATNNAGTEVTLTFDAEMANPSAETSSFTFKEGDATIAVSSAALSGTDAKVIVLTLASAVTSSSSALTIAYAPGALKGADGGAVAAFGPIVVTNNLVGIADDAEAAFDVYPNPFSGQLTITGKSTINSVSIYNVIGAKILEVNSLSSNKVVIPVNELNNGIYFITINTDAFTYSKKVVKQ